MGLGYRSVTLVKTDEFARMDVTDLKAKIAQAQANGEQIMAIVATAGTTDAGAIDPLRDIAGIAAEHRSGCMLMPRGAARCCSPSSIAITSTAWS